MPRTPDFPQSYASCIARLHGRDQVRLPGTATILRRRPDGRMAVTYHWTDIVTFAPDDTITLDTGGWETPSTARKMSAALPGGLAVGQRQGTFMLFLAGRPLMRFPSRSFTLDPAVVLARHACSTWGCDQPAVVSEVRPAGGLLAASAFYPACATHAGRAFECQEAR